MSMGKKSVAADCDRPLRVLVVGEDAAGRLVMVRGLEHSLPDALVEEADAAETVVRRLAAATVDVIVTDHTRPDDAVGDSLERIRQDAPAVPVILWAESGTEKAALQTLKRGVADYVFKSAGPIERLPVVIEHVLERKRLEGRLCQTQKMEAVGHLAGSVAHDFNNLLTAILGYAALAKLPLSPDHPSLSALEQLERAARQAGQVTKALLLFSRRLQTEKKMLDLARCLREVMELLPSLLPPTIRLELALATEAAFWISADETQMQQAVLNLVLKARDAMPDGGTLHIALAAAPGESLARSRRARTANGQWVHLTVKDTGAGLPAEAQAGIFEPFSSAKPSEESVGLTIVRDIVREHGGRIEVESEAGRGTLFRIALPCLDVETEALPPSLPASAPQGQGELILLAEDHVQVAALLAATLHAQGYEVLQAADGLRFLKLYEQNRALVKMLVLDIHLPNRSGVECLRQIRAAGGRVPAILITGGVEPEISAQLDANTVILNKPFQMSELTNLMSAKMRKRQKTNA